MFLRIALTIPLIRPADLSPWKIVFLADVVTKAVSVKADDMKTWKSRIFDCSRTWSLASAPIIKIVVLILRFHCSSNFVELQGITSSAYISFIQLRG